MKGMNVNMKEENNVYIYKVSQQPIFIRLEKTKFKNILNNKERDRIVKLYSKNKVLYNNPVVRLDNIIEHPQLTLEISLIDFFDFISSNMVNMNMDKLRRDCSCISDKELLSKITESISSSNIQSYKDILDNSYLANIIAISVLVEDKNGDIGFVKRGTKVAVGTSYLSVACTGSLDENDFYNDNPIINCVRRELMEELNLIPNNIKITGIVFSKTKLQPIVTISCSIEESFENVIENIKKAVDYEFEVKEFFSVPKIYLKEFIKNEKLTDVAKWQVENIIYNTPQFKNKIKKIDFKL